MYDMYNWSPPDTQADGNGRANATPGMAHRSPVAARAAQHPRDTAVTAAQAVQVALDRRDNGGRAAGEA